MPSTHPSRVSSRPVIRTRKLFADYCGGWIAISIQAGILLRASRPASPPRGREGRRRWRALLSGPRSGASTGSAPDRLRLCASKHHAAPGQPDGCAGSVSDLQRQSLGDAAAPLSVAAERCQHCRSDRAGLHARVRRTGRQRRPVPSDREQRIRQRHQQRGHSHGFREPTASPTISQPAAGTLYSGGSVIAYSGRRDRSEDGTLPASAFTWRVDFHHDTHVHPFKPSTSGVRNGSFTVPTSGETSANVWYRIVLTVRDSAGLTRTTFRDVLPRKVRLTLATSRRTPGSARRSARCDAVLVRRCGGHYPHVGGGQPAGFRRHHLQLRVLVGRWRRTAQHLNAAANTTYRDVSRNQQRKRHGSVGDLLRQRHFQRAVITRTIRR